MLFYIKNNEIIIKNNKLNYKINIDNRNEKYYNKGDDTIIEIFTIKEYNLYKEKYCDYEINLLNDNKVEYQLVEVNNPYDKICRKALDNKKDAVKITGKEKWDAKLDLRTIQYKWHRYSGQELSRYNILDINEISDNEFLI